MFLLGQVNVTQIRLISLSNRQFFMLMDQVIFLFITEFT